MAYVLGRIPARTDQVTLRMERQPASKYPVLDDEQRCARIEIDGKRRIIPVRRRSTDRTSADLPFRVLPRTICEGGPCMVLVEAHLYGTVDGRRILLGEFTRMRDIGRIDLSGRVLPSVSEITAEMEVIAHAPTTTADTVVRATATMRPTIASRDTVRTIIGHDGQIASEGTLTIGYFEFDGTSFASTDQDAIDAVRRAAQAGRRITVLPGTDDLGTEEYNRALQRARAGAALQVLGLRASDVAIVIDPTPSTAASTPMDRIANRSVRVRITND
jgi:hypothetical protein